MPRPTASVAFLAVLASMAFSAPLSRAQIRFYVLDAPGIAPPFAGVGDLDGDGHDDLAFRGQLGFAAPGAVTVVSGADGETFLMLLAGDAAGIDFGHALAGVGDVNGDDVPDFALSAPLADGNGTDAGFVRIVSGAGGGTLLTIHGAAPGERLGHDVAGVGDLDGDGVPDLLASAGDYAGSTTLDNGRARVYSGADGSVIHQWIGPTATERFGWRVEPAGDADADGTTDVMVASLDGNVTRLYSGSSGLLLHALVSTPFDITPAGDLDADGHDDVGLLWNASDDGYLRVHSGATGAVLREFGQGDPVHFGDSAAMLGDVDADGVPDYALGGAGVDSEASGIVRVFSGATAAELYFTHEVPGGSLGDSSFGFTLAAVGDVDGNGLIDFASTSGQKIGVFAGQAAAIAAFAQGPVEGATAATLSGAGSLLPGSEFTLQAAALPPGAATWLVVGFSQVDAPFQGGTLVPSADVLAGPLPADGAGALTFTGRWPPGLPDFSSIWFQAWAIDGSAPQGLRSTNGLVATQH